MPICCTRGAKFYVMIFKCVNFLSLRKYSFHRLARVRIILYIAHKTKQLQVNVLIIIIIGVRGSAVG